MKRAVVTTVSSDSHSWNLVFLQLLLEENGFDVTNVGPCATVDSVVATVATVRPRLVAVSSVNGHGYIEAPAYASALAGLPHRDEFALVIGGMLTTDGDPGAERAQRLLLAGFDDVFVGEHALGRFTARVRRVVPAVLAG